MENENPPPPPADVKRRRLTRAEREFHLASWKRSGLSGPAYARAHGLSPANLYAWRGKALGGGASASAARPAAKTASPFVPVRIAPGPPAAGTAPRVVLRDGYGLECVIEGAVDAGAFAALAGALKREVFGV